MDVSEIITIVANQSLDSDTPDAEDKARILRYVNQAYLYILQEINAQDNEFSWFEQVVSTTNGSVELTFDRPASIKQVIDRTNEVVLKEASLEDILALDPTLSKEGEAEFYYITNRTTLNVWPKASTSLNVLGVADPNSLEETTTSADIRIPKLYQNILIPATLKWVHADERDATSASVMRDNERMLEDRLSRLKQFMYQSSTLKTPQYPFA